MEVLARAETAWQLVSDEFEAAEQAMSRFRPWSDLSALNRVAGSGEQIAVERRLVRALVAADRAWRATGGRFDARILADLERLGHRSTSAGPPAALSGRLPRARDTATRWLKLDSSHSRAATAVAVDLDGIGKGLALRWAWRCLERVGALVGGGALIEAGGDLVAGGSSPDGGPWMVGLEDPFGHPEPVAVIALRGGSLATSSVRINRWTTPDGQLAHHLIDPRTGEPGGEGLLQVTVARPDPAWAEIWSKTLFLAGGRGITGEARARGLAAWWVRQDSRVEMTAAARQQTAWVADEA